MDNPKEQAGQAKCPMHLLPPEALRQVAEVLKHGADKYGAWNWREAGINASTYIAAIYRHLSAWQDGEDLDPESGKSHIAHVAACCAILMDAGGIGMVNDDRSRRGTSAAGAAPPKVDEDPTLQEVEIPSICHPLPKLPRGKKRWVGRGTMGGVREKALGRHLRYYDTQFRRWVGTDEFSLDFFHIEAV